MFLTNELKSLYIKKGFIYIIAILIIILVIGCTGSRTDEETTKISSILIPILSDDFGVEPPRTSGEKVIKFFSYLEDETGIIRPIILDNQLIGEASLFTSTEYYALLNNKYKTGFLTYEKYVQEMEKAYNDRNSKEFSIIINSFSNDETYLKGNNWKLTLIINDEKYKPFKLKKDYAQDYMPHEQKLPDNKTSYGRFKTSFSITMLPKGSKPEQLISLPLITSLELGIEIIKPNDEDENTSEDEEETTKNPLTTQIEWNNSDLYRFYIPDNTVKKTFRGNELDYTYLKNEQINIVFDKNIYLDITTDDFPYPIPNIEKGLFNLTIYSIGRVLNDEEYKLKKKIEDYVNELKKEENKKLKEKIMTFSEKAPFNIIETILGDYVFTFDDYFTERKLIDIPEEAEIRKEHNIKKMSFISKNKRLISLTYYFDESENLDRSTILEDFASYKSNNILQPYTLNDRTKRVSLNKDSKSLVIIDNEELRNIIAILKMFERYYNYFRKYDNLSSN